MSAGDLELAECEREACAIALRAGELLRAAWARQAAGPQMSVEQKLSEADLVTETDQAVEKLVFEALRRAFPHHRLVGEESSADGPVNLTDEPTWIVDPVDGTTNFVHTFPYVAVCLGLAVNKQPVLGVVYCPALGQLFRAHRGGGAFLNEAPLRLAARPAPKLAKALVLTELGSDRSPEKRHCVFANMAAIGWQCHGLRSLGSAAMNALAVAQGHADAYYEFGIHCWDVCAAAAVLAEAGGHLCDPDGGPFDLLSRRCVLAAGPELALELAAALPVKIQPQRD